ncbi:Hypothetical protein NocV09_04000110 [Nannochloropsis oceanica]
MDPADRKKRKLSPSSASSSSSTSPKLTPFAFGFYNDTAAVSMDHGLDGEALMTAATTSNPANAAPSPTPQQPPHPHPSRQTHPRQRRITTRYAWLHLHQPNDSMTPTPSRERVRVLWEMSSSASSLKVRRRNGEILRVTARDLSPLDQSEQGRNEEDNQEFVEHLDLFFDNSRAATAHQGLPFPPQIGPDLATLIYPLTTEYFLKEVWNKKALVIQGGATRLKRFCRDLGNSHASANSTAAAPAAVKRSSSLSSSLSLPSFTPLTMDIPSLLEQAHRIVVWMKTKTKTQRPELSDNGKKSSGDSSSTGKSSTSTSSKRRKKTDVALPEMQYLDNAPASVALACHRAGHSLYFNPPPSLQHPYIHSLCLALGLLPLLPSPGGPAGPAGREGDMEIFAVRPPHHTPAHWDSQHNFTIQIRGRKQWVVSKSGLSEPLSNHHPSSSNHRAKEQDLALHIACGYPQDRLLPPHLSHGDVCGRARQAQNHPLPRSLPSFAPPSSSSSSFVLRPGAVMYLPAGWWHAVTALSDEEDGEEVEEEEGEGGEEEEEEDCLSVNMSLDPCRWRDLMTGSMGPLLWGGGAGGEDQGWRERAQVVGIEGGREGGGRRMW